MLNPSKETEQRCVDCRYFYYGWPSETTGGCCLQQHLQSHKHHNDKNITCNIDKFEPKRKPNAN